MPDKNNKKRVSTSAAEASLIHEHLDETAEFNLTHPGIVEWAKRTEEDRDAFISRIFKRYDHILAEFYQTAESSAGRFRKSSQAYARWRKTLIVGTGVLAGMNAIAAYVSYDKNPISGWANLAIWVAIFAAGLAILANLESFFNYSEKARAFRESRELFLDGMRDFEHRWYVYVVSFGFSPEACTNASELYRQITIRDQELRAKFKELTETRKQQ